MKYKNTLLSFKKDIEERSLWDWIKAHTSFMKPLHRYSGVFEFDKNKIAFNGEDAKERKNFSFTIPFKNIKNIHLGYDEIFTRWEDRAAPWNKPLRIDYIQKDSDKIETIYLFVNFHRKLGMRTSDNKEVYSKLKERV